MSTASLLHVDYMSTASAACLLHLCLESCSALIALQIRDKAEQVNCVLLSAVIWMSC